MCVRSIFLALFIFLFTLNLVQMDPGAEAWVFEEKRERTESESRKGEFSPLEDSFVHYSCISDDSQSKALGYCGLWPHAFIEIRHAPVYVLDTSFRC